MSALAKVYLWKNVDGKTVPIKDGDDLKIKIVDRGTGEFVVEGANVAVFYQHMFMLSDNQTEEEKKHD